MCVYLVCYALCPIQMIIIKLLILKPASALINQALKMYCAINQTIQVSLNITFIAKTLTWLNKLCLDIGSMEQVNE